MNRKFIKTQITEQIIEMKINSSANNLHFFFNFHSKSKRKKKKIKINLLNKSKEFFDICDPVVR